jgi:hypothetical protein
MSDAVTDWKRELQAWQLRVAAWLALPPDNVADIDVEPGPPTVVTWKSVGWPELRAPVGHQEAPQVTSYGDGGSVFISSKLYLDHEHAEQLVDAAGERPAFPDLGLPQDWPT